MRLRYKVATAILALILLGYWLMPYAEKIFEQQGIVASILFLLVIITEVVLAPIPGGIIGFLGAGHFGFFKAWPIMWLGNVIGATIAFNLAQKFGMPLIKRMVKKEDIKKYNERVRSNHNWLWLFYSLPIFPIDIISFLAGFSTLKFSKFIKIVAPAVAIYTAITAFIGAFLGQYIPHLNYIAGGVFVIFIGFVIYYLLTLNKN